MKRLRGFGMTLVRDPDPYLILEIPLYQNDVWGVTQNSIGVVRPLYCFGSTPDSF